MSAEDELLELQEQLLQSRATMPPVDVLRTFLRLSREARIKNPEQVANYGTLLLKHYRRDLQEEELWLVHEQVAIALLECNSVSAAATLIKAVLVQFQDSSRAARLQGMYYEAAGKYDRAQDVYKGVLEKEPSNELIAKRLVALHRTRGDVAAAAAALRQYLDTFMNDRDAWEELAELYLELSMYRQAAFCYEELLTQAPTQVNYLLRYADTLATIGGAAGLKMARAYYSRVVQLTQGRNPRALFGVLACHSSHDKVEGQVAEQLHQAAAEMLQKLYREQAPEKAALVQGQ